MFDINWIKQKVISGDDYFSFHAERERQNDNLTLTEIKEALLNGIILEQYEDTGRGESCLVVGFTSQGSPFISFAVKEKTN